MTPNKVNIVCEEAIMAISKGDREALSVIYDSMARMIFSVALAVTGSTADAEDVLQDTMIGIVRSAHTYKKGTNARAWILAVARNRAIDTVRRRKNPIPLEDVIHLPDPSQEPTCVQSAAKLLSPLREADRQVVVLRLYQELPFEEIAQILGITLATAQKRYQRSIQKLKKYYCKGENDNERTGNEEDPSGVGSPASAIQGKGAGSV